ncbi:hypothetical protein ACWGH8_04480 [Nonomuraea muscovyensis]
MEDDHRVWPPHPGPRHRRTPPYGTGREPGARRGRPYGPARPDDTRTGGPAPGGRPDSGGTGRDGGHPDGDNPLDGDGRPGRDRSSEAAGAGGADTSLGGGEGPGGAAGAGRFGAAWPASGGEDELDARWPSTWRDEDPEGVWDDDDAEEEPWNPRVRRTAPRDTDRGFVRALHRVFGRGVDGDTDGGLGSGPDRGFGQDIGGGPDRGFGHDADGGPERGFGRDADEGFHSGLGRGLDRDEGPRAPWQSLPPSARLYGAPADPGLTRKARGRGPRRAAGAVLAVLLAVAAVASIVVAVQRFTATPAEAGRLHDPRARVTIPLPAGWRAEVVPPVTGFTTAAVDGAGGLVMARPFDGATREAVVEAAELYSRLLLKGDRVTVVEDRQVPGGHTRVLRAEYQDVVNRPAYLRVILLTRGGGAVLVVGLLQPDEPARRQALDALMSSVR